MDGSKKKKKIDTLKFIRRADMVQNTERNPREK